MRARACKHHRFRNLYREINLDLLRRSFRELNPKAAKGVDEVTYHDYANGLEERLKDLVERLKHKRYRARLVRRVMIPKGKGKERPLGIPALEDKLVQRAAAKLLNAIYEQDFIQSSYGYRPRRSPKEAIEDLTFNLQYGSYGYLVEADIKGFFDHLDHDWLITMLEQRVDDKAFLRLIRKWLKAGILDTDGQVLHPETGSPQGGIISPILANIYLYYALDLWFEKVVKPGCAGRAIICRYADDCAPRRRTGGCESSVQPCCTRDEGGPLGAAVQAEASNHLLLLHLKGVVVSEYGKGRSRTGQVRAVKSNASEPLMTCRKRRDDVKTGGKSLTRDKSGRNLSTAQAASGIKAARTRLRLLCGTWEPVTPMLRERCKWKPHEYLSTNAGYRGGATCSSEEGSVMELERRGCPIQPETRVQPAMGGHS
ncbi:MULTISPECIES: reverse transcriptase domain-containing protein [unclassified Microbulbifer]|uniref:reverse transcriptase domain-containing protein n=1 Tax=unclassified Microbulbifer TaxID=2619833 RepID=UPI0027E50848|nr:MULTISPECIES: reverse transcriptase domain-containing protein [unclassified Microbulbifer]